MRAHLKQRLDLGLALEPAGPGAKLAELVGHGDVHVGDEAFDAKFEVHGLEAARVLALLTPALREALLRWHAAKARFVVDDACVFLRLPMKALWGTGALTQRDVNTPEQLLQNLRAAMALADLFDDAAQTLPPAKALTQHADAFRAYATAHGLGFSAAPLAVFGRVAGSQLYGHALVREKRLAVSLELRFDNPLPETLRVESKSALSFMRRLKAFATDTDVGDPAFDDAFELLVASDGVARRWLSDPVRRGLLVLHDEVGDVTLTPRGISIETRDLPEPAGIGTVFERLCDVERSLRLAMVSHSQP